MTLRSLAGVLGACLLVLGIGVPLSSEASHFRGNAMIPTVDENGLLTIESVSFWRQNTSNPSQTCGIPQDCVGSLSFQVREQGSTLIGSGQGLRVSMDLDLSDSRRTKVTEVFEIQLPGAGIYDISWSSCCWVSGIANASSSTANSSRIVWDGQSANAPILFDLENVQQTVVQGSAYSESLGVVAGPGVSLSFDSTVLSTGMNGQPPGYSISDDGVIEISEEHTALMTHRNNNNPGADYAFSGRIGADDGSFVNFVWVFDVQDERVGPTVDDQVINALVGDIVSTTMLATHPDPDAVIAWDDILDFLGPGGVAVPADTFSFDFDTDQLFTWDTAGFAPGSYQARFRASDGTLTDIGMLTINLAERSEVPPPASAVPAPGALPLLGLSVLALALGRRRLR